MPQIAMPDLVEQILGEVQAAHERGRGDARSAAEHGVEQPEHPPSAEVVGERRELRHLEGRLRAEEPAADEGRRPVASATGRKRRSR